MQQTCKGKLIIITGASSGAGRAIALELAKKGAAIVLAARNMPELKKVAAECKALGGEVMIYPVDVSIAANVAALAAAAYGWKGWIDVWVNNAGVLAAGAFETTPWEVHEQVIRTNLFGYMLGAYTVLPYFKKQGRGILINNISVGGFLPVPYGGAY